MQQDPQKHAIYEEQFEVSEPIAHERLSRSTLRSLSETLWDKRAPSEFRSPKLCWYTEDNIYLPQFHSVYVADPPFVTILLHELAHAIVASMGRTLLTEGHGSLFCHEFGKLWEIYSTEDFEVWKSRWERRGVDVLDERPDFSNMDWALLQEPEIAVRPAEDAIRSEYEVQGVFTDVDLHPLT